MNREILVLAIGNDIIGDDAAGLVAAEELSRIYSETIDFEYVYGGGLEILDFIEGRERVLVLDTISTRQVPNGEIIEFEKNDFSYTPSNSPHYVGLPEVMKLAVMFELDFPNDIKILAIETSLQNEVIEGLSPEIRACIPEYVKRASTILDEWLKEEVAD